MRVDNLFWNRSIVMWFNNIEFVALAHLFNKCCNCLLRRAVTWGKSKHSGDQ